MNRRHGESRTRLYGLWKAMRRRVVAPQVATTYRDRGIAVCPQWQDWPTFRAWALSSGYLDDLSLDRIDNDKGYQPDNCRWVSRVVQNANRRPAAEWRLPQRKVPHASYPMFWEARSTGATYQSIADRFGVSIGTAHRICALGDPS